MRIDDLMTREVRTVRSDTPLKEAARILAEFQVSGLPVVDSDGYVLGVLSEGDILFKEIGIQDTPASSSGSSGGHSAGRSEAAWRRQSARRCRRRRSRSARAGR